MRKCKYQTPTLTSWRSNFLSKPFFCLYHANAICIEISSASPYIECILNETSKPPVNKTHIFNITHLLLNCLNDICHSIFGRMYASIEHDTVRFNKDVHLCVTIEYLYLFCTWHTNAKCSLPCVYSFFHRQLLDSFILSPKCQRLGCMSIK